MDHVPESPSEQIRSCPTVRDSSSSHYGGHKAFSMTNAIRICFVHVNRASTCYIGLGSHAQEDADAKVLAPCLCVCVCVCV